jgi:RHS repeat-associated protein
MVYNNADQLISWPGVHGTPSVAGYTYHDDGSLHQVLDDDGSEVQRTYTYTPDGLLSTTSYGATTLTNTWDADRNRVALEVGEDTYQFVYDPTASVPAVLAEVTPEDGTVYYIREPSGALIARVDGESMRYYHFDQLGSTRLLTDDDGAVTDRYTYDAYGNRLTHDTYTGSVDQPYQYVGQLGYYNHYQSPDFALLQLGVRFYDTEVGRFTQLDPVWRIRWSSYLYTSAIPTVQVDPAGMIPWERCMKHQMRKLDDDAWEKAWDCYLKAKGDKEKLKQCLADIGVDGACEIYACTLVPEGSTTEGTERNKPYYGYPCEDPRAEKFIGYCQGCAHFKFNKCLCKAAKNAKKGGEAAVAACDTQHKNDLARCLGKCAE